MIVVRLINKNETNLNLKEFMMSNTTENRKHRRVEASVPLRYKELRGNTYLTKGTLSKNLSEGGTRFNTDKFIPLSAHLMIEMRLPAALKDIKMVTKIAWIKKLPACDEYEIGSNFLAMSGEDEALISNFVKSFLKNSPIKT